MTIDGVASYGEIYSENLTEEDIKNFDDFGVEWRGRNIYEIRDDFCIKAIVIFARVYLETARTNPEKLPELKAEIVQIFEDIFESEDDEDDEPSPLLYRFDPISGAYLELIGAEKKVLKKIGKGFKKAGKAVGKGVKKAEKAVTKGVRETGRWVREHPVETTVIVVAAVAIVVTVGAASGAVAGAIAGSAEVVGSAAAAAAASTAGSNNNRRKDSDDEPSSSPPPNPPFSQRTPLTTSSTVSAPSRSFNTTSTYTSNTSQGFSTSNPLPQDPFPHRAFSNHAYELSAPGSGSPSSHPAPLVMPTSLTHEPKTYSTPASIMDIPNASSYGASSKGTSTLTNHLTRSSLPIERYKQGEFSLPQQSGINPIALHSSLFPGYQEPQTSHLSAKPSKVTSDQKQNAANISKAEAVADFTKGFLKGFPQGSLHSVKNIPSTIATAVKTVATLDSLTNPIVPNQASISQMTAVYETAIFLGTCDKNELCKAVAPELHTLFTDWDSLSHEERGSLIAHCFGEYGTDFVLLPIAAAKGAKVVGGVLKEASALGRLESGIAAAAKEVEAVEAIVNASKLAKGGSPLAEGQTVVQKYFASEELRKDLAEVLAHTEKALGSKTFAEEKAFTEEINQGLINLKLTSTQPGRFFSDIEKELFSDILNVKPIKDAGLDIEALSRAGNALDRAELTRAGRALMKHGNREGSVFPKPAGNAAEVNKNGQMILEQILRDPKSQVFTTPEGGAKIYAPDGRGAHFRKDGSFKGFIEQQHE